jgi:hypothetical protein
MGVQYCKITVKSCPMFDPNCAAKIAEHVVHFRVQPFTKDEALALIEKCCGRYSRGKHVGQLRGWAEVHVCTEGGWWRLGPGERNGRVLYPGMLIAVVIRDYNGKVLFEEGLVRMS